MNILTKAKNSFVLFDGGMGTMIQRHMKLGQLPEELNLTLPEVIEGVHRAYLEAGCDVVETNTLNANRRKLSRIGKTPDEVIHAAVGNARRAADACGREAWVALSMGSTGSMLEPLGDLSFGEAVSLYEEMARAGEKAGADLILIETVSDLHEIKAALTAAKNVTGLPVAVTMTFAENGRTLTGADIVGSCAVLEALGADIVGMNCGLGPAQMLKLAPELMKNAHVPVLINPNAGLPRLVDGQNVYSVDPETFARDAAQLARMGARLVGGCCGTTPDHIRALKKALEGIFPCQPMTEERLIIASGSRWAELSGGISIADTGDGDAEDRVDEALDAEADVIRVSGEGLADIVRQMQETVLSPMYLVAENADEAQEALTAYNGKPLLGIANPENFYAYLEIARKGGAALAVSDEALLPKACEILGAENALLGRENVLTDSQGRIAARIEP